MKKILLVSLLLLGLLGIASCDKDGNQKMSGSDKYDHVHISIDDKCIHDDVLHYMYDGDGTIIQVETKTYGWILGTTGILLYNSDRCPICGK